MSSPSAQTVPLKTLVSPAIAAAFNALCADSGVSASSLLRQLVGHVVSKAEGLNLEQATQKAARQKSERVTVRFSNKEMADLRNLLGEFQTPREWIVALVRDRLRTGAPTFTSAEIEALYASNRELYAIGRNINQIARAFNSDLVQAGRITERRDQVAQLSQLKEQISQHVSHVTSLCSASANRWGEK